MRRIFIAFSIILLLVLPISSSLEAPKNKEEDNITIIPVSLGTELFADSKDIELSTSSLSYVHEDTSLASDTCTRNAHYYLEWTVTAPQYEIVEIDGRHYINVDGFSTISIPGAPVVPRKGIALGIPPNARVDYVEIMDYKYEELPGSYNLISGPPLQTLAYGSSVIYTGEKNRLTYYSNDPWPYSSPVAYVMDGYLRDYHIVLLDYYPFIYYPMSGKLVFYSKVSFRIHYHYDENIAYTESKKWTIFDQLAASIIENYDSVILNGWRKHVIRPVEGTWEHRLEEGDYDYVIICKSELSSTFENLKNLKETYENLRVKMVTLEWINSEYSGRDLMEKVHNFLIDAYNTWGITYALLGFDANVFGSLDGVRYVYNPDPDDGADDDYVPGIGNDYTPTDDYFAGLDTNWDLDMDEEYGESKYYNSEGKEEADLFYDIFVGRIPANNATQVQNYISKLSTEYIQREQERPGLILFAGAWLFPWYNSDGAYVCYHIEWEGRFMEDIDPTHSKTVRLFESTYYPPGANLSSSQFIESASMYDPAIYSWDAHGSPEAAWTYYGSYFIARDTVPDLDVSRYGFVWAMSCLTGAIDSTESGGSYGDSLGEAWTVLYPTGGIGYYAYPRVTWGWVGSYGENETGMMRGLTVGLQVLTWKYRNRFNISEMGPLIYSAKVLYYVGGFGYSSWAELQGSASDFEIERKSVMCGMLLGDPQFAFVPSRIPHKPEIKVIEPTGILTTTKPKFHIKVYDESGIDELVVKLRGSELLVTKVNETDYYATVEERLLPGKYVLQVYVKNKLMMYTDAYREIYVPQPLTFADNYSYGYPLYDDVESGNIGWETTGNWHITTSDYHSPTHSWYTGEYENYAEWNLTSPPIDLRGISSAELSFWHKYSIEEDYDHGYVEISIDGGESWATLKSFTGEQLYWSQVKLDISTFTGSEILLRFRLESDSSVTYDGWWIDDIVVTVKSPASVIDTGSYWHLTSTDYYTSPQSMWCGDEEAGTYPNNVNDSLVYLFLAFPGMSSLYLSFYTKYDFGTGDYGFIEYSFDMNTWVQIGNVSGSGGWEEKTYNLTPMLNEILSHDGIILIRFRLYADSTVNGGGWFIDNLFIGGSVTDKIPPKIIFLEPGPLTNVSDVHIKLHVSDNVGIDHTLIRVDEGAWVNIGTSTEYDVTLPEGTHSIEAVTFDTSGNPSYNSTTVIVDLSPPVLEIVNPANNTYVPEDYVDIALDVYDALSGVDHLEIRIDEITWISVGTSTMIRVYLLEGKHLIEIKAIDMVGWSTIKKLYVHIDLTNPEVTIVEPDQYEPVSGLNGTLYAEWIGLDNLGLDHYEISIDNTTYVDVNLTNSLYINMSTYSEGIHTLFVKAIDKSGRETIAKCKFIWDITPPTVTIVSPYDNSYIGYRDVTLSWLFSDNYPRISTEYGSYEPLFYVKIDDGEWKNYGSVQSATLEIDEGWHTIYVKGYDPAGNYMIDNITVCIDLTAPDLAITSPTYGEVIGSSAVEVAWSGKDTLSDIDYYMVKLDGERWIVTNTTSIRYSRLSEGQHTIYIRAYNKAGLSTEQSVIFMIDLTPPSLEIISPENGSTIEGDSIGISWSYWDNYGVDHVEIQLDDGAWIDVGVSTSYVFSDVGPGGHRISIRVIDRAGYEVTQDVYVFVKSSAPAIQIGYAALFIGVIALIMSIILVATVKKKKIE